MADFPDVPVAPGVPQVPRDPLASTVESLIVLSSDLVAGFGSNAWGIYQNGAPVITPDTFASVEFKKDWSIPTYPQEDGAFQSYNKVEMPYTARVTLASGGDVANREALLAQVQAIAGNVELYDVVTPEQVYVSANVQRYDFRRTQTNGAGMIVISVYLEEVRVSASDNGSSTAAPSGASAANDGTVQASPDAPPTQGSVQAFQNGTDGVQFLDQTPGFSGSDTFDQRFGGGDVSYLPVM